MILIAALVSLLLVAGVAVFGGGKRGSKSSANGTKAQVQGTAVEKSTTTTTLIPPAPPADTTKLSTFKNIGGAISPKSVVASGHGLVSAHNMMYRHTVTMYDVDGNDVATIPDDVTLSNFGIDGHPGVSKGAPVEAAYSADGSQAYVSNYSMYGANFTKEGDDNCTPKSGYSSSYLYRIDTKTHAIDGVAPVGAVPKYVATTPDNKYVLVTNWCTWDLSVVDAATMKEVKRVPLNAFPRGIAVTPDSKTAYIAVMGAGSLAKVNLTTFDTTWIRNVGSGPRHAVLDPTGKWLYVTLNGAGTVIKIDTASDQIVGRVRTGQAPRSMAISNDGTALYVVNYESNNMTKLRAADLSILQTVPTGTHPIGITYEPIRHRVWVAIYSGNILVLNDL